MQTTVATGNNKKRLRIAVDIRSLNYGSSGIQTATIALLDKLQMIDISNEYLLFETRKSAYVVSNQKWKKILLPTFHLLDSLWTLIVFPFYLWKYGVDVLWAPCYICPLWFFRKIKLYTSIHDLAYLHFPSTLLFKDRVLFCLFVPLSAKLSSAVISNSKYIKRDIEKNLKPIKTPVVAIPLGKPDWTIPAIYSPAQRQDFLFFAGNIEPRKNLLNAIKALEILHSQGRSIELHIASPSSWKAGELIDYINRSPVKGNIKYLGFLSLGELKKKYLFCKAVLYPSFYEGFGLPVIEALVMDCPVLTSQNTVMQEIAEASALYFNPIDPLDIAEKIRMVYSEGFDRNLYLKNKKRVLEKYSWGTAAHKMLLLFESGSEHLGAED